MYDTDLSLDHVVILVADLDRAIADYSALGFNVQRGGTHADGFTHNALIGFADGSYLELIAFLRPRPDHRWGGFAARGHSGFVDFALLPSSVGEVVARARAAGLAYQGPIDGGRTRLDGEVLRWQTGTPPSADLPFLCGDVTPRSLRVREGEVRVHANGVSGIASITVQVGDLQRSIARYSALLSAPPTPPATCVAGAEPSQAAFKIGPTWLMLVASRPGGHGSSVSTGGAEVSAPTNDGVVGMTLRGTACVPLSRERTHGAAIDIQIG